VAITTVLDVLRNDNDLDGSLDPATLMVVSGSDMADVVVQAGGTILFTPRAGFLGSTQFRYVVSDNEGRPSAPTDVSVQVVVSIYQNPRNRFDVDDDKTVSPLDVLLLVNLLNVAGPSLPIEALPGPPPYVDVNGDNLVSPLDVLEVINYINSGGSTSGEGEGAAWSDGPGEQFCVTPAIPRWPSDSDRDADRFRWEEALKRETVVLRRSVRSSIDRELRFEFRGFVDSLLNRVDLTNQENKKTTDEMVHGTDLVDRVFEQLHNETNL
jgi:hypothetical protein